MRVQVDSSALKRALSGVAPAVSGNSPLPILQSVKLEAREDSLTLTATDLEMGIVCRLPAEVEEEGALAFGERLLGDAIGRIGEGTVSIAPERSADVETRGSIRIAVGETEFFFYPLPAESFPPLPQVTVPEMAFSIPVADLQRLLHTVALSVSQDNTQPTINGASFELSKSLLTVVSTDTLRLGLARATVTEYEGSGKAILPRDTLSVLQKACVTVRGAEAPPPARVKIDANQAFFDLGHTTVICRRIEGTFPDWTRLLFSPNGKSVEVATRDLLAACDRAGLVARDSETHRMQVTIETGRLRVSARSGVAGSIKDAIPATLTGEGFQFQLSYRFLADALRSLSAERVCLLPDENARRVEVRPVDSDRERVILAAIG